MTRCWSCQVSVHFRFFCLASTRLVSIYLWLPSAVWKQISNVETMMYFSVNLSFFPNTFFLIWSCSFLFLCRLSQLSLCRDVILWPTSRSRFINVSKRSGTTLVSLLLRAVILESFISQQHCRLYFMACEFITSLFWKNERFFLRNSKWKPTEKCYLNGIY